MALLRQCLNQLRTRRLSAQACALALAAQPDSVVPPLDREEIEALLAAGAGSPGAAEHAGLPGPRLGDLLAAA